MSEMEAAFEEMSTAPENGLDHTALTDDNVIKSDDLPSADNNEGGEGDEDDIKIEEEEIDINPSDEQEEYLEEEEDVVPKQEEPPMYEQVEEEPPMYEQVEEEPPMYEQVKEEQPVDEQEEEEPVVKQEDDSQAYEIVAKSDILQSSESDSSPVKSPRLLPECKVKRSYVCGFCNMLTTNPRIYLYHLRDEHKENAKIYECPRCIYATKTQQKLIRHNEMVHKIRMAPQEAEENFSPAPEPPKKKIKKEKESKPVTKTKPSLMSRSPRESKSPRRFEEYEFPEDEDFEMEDESEPEPTVLIEKKKFKSKKIKTTFLCSECDYSCTNAKVLTAHENKKHANTTKFQCNRCNYTTTVRSRYTKHLKYHNLKIVKCEYCDFRTPYPWNMDRHNKNHVEDLGVHKCHLCNFSAQIRQSLTVHISNHHLTPDQIKEREAKRTIGVTDTKDESESPNESFLDTIDDEALRLERFEDPDSLELPSSFTVSSIDVGDSREDLDNSTNENEDGERQNKKPKIKITLKKMKSPKSQSVSERHNFDDDFVHPDDVVQRNGNIYIKSEKCSLCNFKAPFQTEIIRHKKKVHGIYSLKNPTLTTLSNKKTTGPKTLAKKTKKVKSYEQLINGNDIFTEDGFLKNPFDDLSEFVDKNTAKTIENEEDFEDSKIEDEAVKSDSSEGKESSSKKKSSFFDKLQEKLSVSNVQNLVCQFCGHESKCLSESVRHQKLHLSAKNIGASASLSTRCQFCRHRCKTTDDLISHLKLCTEARKNQISDNMKSKTSEKSTKDDDEDDEIKHPMENKVFVWNNITKAEDDRTGTPTASDSTGTNTPEPKVRTVTSKVFRCPHCSFRSTTASRFHVHMVGHINVKPYSCSECGYRSNWRWDITKHIKLKVAKDINHESAEVLQSENANLIDKNYEKYGQYVTEVSREEIHHSEGGLSNSRKGPKKSVVQDSDGSDSAKSSPCPTPNLSTSSKLPAPPKLTRAPNRLTNPLEPLLAGDSQKPPPLVAMATQLADRGFISDLQEDNNDPSNNQTMQSQTETSNMSNTPTTSLETLQLLASGSTNLARLKRQQQETGEGNDPELDAAVANQMRLLLWMNCLVGGAEKKLQEGEAIANGTTTDSAGDNNTSSPVAAVDNSAPEAPNTTNIMQLVLDHEGNPEWKCLSCEFRDNEQDTVSQHVRLAHGKKGPVSLVHAVHRCSVCGFAAGTKRHVQVHLDQAHNGQGGIISRSEGQNIEPVNGAEERTYDCRVCPFKSKKKGELKTHLSHHTPRADFVFKCMFCSFFVATKNELFSHLSLHGMDIPASAKESPEPVTTNVTSQASDDGGARQFKCDMCPFETRIRAKMMHHRQFHRPRGLPFRCPHCSYNVTRRHLLDQHLLIHTNESTNEGGGGAATPTATPECRKSPAPSLTITPIANNSETLATTSSIDPARLPVLSDELTKNLHDIPLVWVSREGRYFKMFKCRHCPHVNLRKTNIQEHEKMHRPEGLAPGTGHNCVSCSYVCINAGVMSAHVKVHSGSMGICHAIVDPVLANEEQLKMLTAPPPPRTDDKALFYCQHCPARFFLGKEVQIHSRFHASNHPCACPHCSFRAREESQVLAHAKVHTIEYQERTRTLMSVHPPASNFPPVPGLTVPGEQPTFAPKEQEPATAATHQVSQSNGLSRPWLATPPLPVSAASSRFKCDLCPSSFTKQITLQYHQSLHGAGNPFKCSRCNYAAKTQDGLLQHAALHDDVEKASASRSASATPSPAPSPSPQKMLETALSMGAPKPEALNLDQPPIKLKIIGLKGNGTSSKSLKKQQFKYYIEEQVPLSGVELLKRKTQMEQELPTTAPRPQHPFFLKATKNQEDLPKERRGNPQLNYPLHIDKASGRTREKRYKCCKCPSAFDKMDQFTVHINLHGTKYKYRCKLCDYTVKFYANFMMHIKRHKYHEHIDAQNSGNPMPQDDDPRFEPSIGFTTAREEPDNKENLEVDKCVDMTTAEKQQLVLQSKKADAFLPKDEDKKIFYCEFCPYASVRRDAVDSHSLRHIANGGKGLYRCNFCDYTAKGPNFIREHTKVHFRPFKFVVPEGFMRHEKLDLYSIKSGDDAQDAEEPKKSHVLSHSDGTFLPKGDGDEEATEVDDGILVDFRSGDVIDAPEAYIIPMRLVKGKYVPSGTKPKSKKARKHSKIKANQSQTLPSPQMMDFDESQSGSLDACNGTSPTESCKGEISDESNQFMELQTIPAVAN